MTRVSLWVVVAAIIALTILPFVATFAGDLPDTRFTSPQIDKTCTIDTIRTNDTTARRHATQKDKDAQLSAYGVKQDHRPDCNGPGQACWELDDLMPLEVCGLNVKANLWPMPYFGPCSAKDKDNLENHTKADLLLGHITLDQAQSRFLSPDWREEFFKRFEKRCN